MRKTITGLALACLLTACLLTACSSTVNQPGVATAGGGGSASPTASSDVVTQYVAGVRTYVRCMRAEGIDLPDPDAKGKIDYSLPGGGQRKKDPKFVAASEKCAPLLPPMPSELIDQGPPLTPEQITRARQYAKCMRDHGVPDFPDPDAQGHWPGQQSDPTMTEQQTRASYLASVTCEPVLDGHPPASPDPNATGKG
jgi:hypothetical protein